MEEYSDIWEVLFGEGRKANNMYFFDPPQDKQWLCPACGKKGAYINSRFGTCNHNKKCRCISLEFEEHDTASYNNIRKPFSIHLNKNKHSKTTKTFYTDGSGTRLNRESDVMTTGWAAVEVNSERVVVSMTDGLDKHQLLYDKIRHSSDLSPNYESVQWCEARAILEAIRMAEPNCNIHIHTDSLCTMLRIQSMRYDAYRKNRRKKHKELTQDILEAAEQVNGTVIIEWVKAHESEIPKDKDNWIRKLKSMGNDMADEEAKRVVQQGIVSSVEKCLKGPWVLHDKSTDLPLDWTALPKAVLLLYKKKRQQRLATPTKDCDKYGQGQYNEAALRNRSLAFKLISKPINLLKYKTLVFNYSINKINCRAELVRRTEAINRKTGIDNQKACPVANNLCPICQIGLKMDIVQTKEHIFSGECMCTECALKSAQDAIEDLLVSGTYRASKNT